MKAYYNEFEPYAADWLENLMAAGLIPAGDVDRRDIREVSADDLQGYTQCHFFAGIAGWSHALRLAGWPDDKPVWTGSCPCQPLSSAGQRQGHADERHLWPAFHELIAECKPSVVFGEQVASKDGREWLAGVRADLEVTGYAVGAADLPAASVGAPFRRQRLFWIATSIIECERMERCRQKPIQRQPALPWPQDVRRPEDWRNRSDVPQPALCDFYDGLSSGVDQVCAAGNAIVPQVAAEFIGAYMDLSP